MSHDLVLKPMCSSCGSTTDLYGSNCKHMTLCINCGRTMAEKRAKCYECGATLSRLIREYPVRASSSVDKNYGIARFVSGGLPNFSKKKNAENKWSLQKEGLVGRQVTDSLREKYKNKPWLLEDESGQFQYIGHFEGAQSATYYLLMLQGKEFNAIPAGSWYNFSKVAQYKQLTLEEAEEKMKSRRKTADGYERWMMKAAKDGPAAFGEGGRYDEPESGGLRVGKGVRKKDGDEEEGNASDNGDEDDEFGRKSGIKGGNDDEEEGPGGDDFDLEDEIEKGDDWEHEEVFTDDDEATAIDPEEREDLAPEVPAPPEIKEDDEEEEEGNEEEGGLSKSGKELKKLLGRNAEKNESEDDDDDDEDMDDDNLSPVLAPKKKDAPKEEPVDNSPAKSVPSGSAKGTPPTSKSSKGKRKLNGDDVKPSNVALPKKVKTENGQESGKEENGASRTNIPPRGTPPPSKIGTISSTATGPVTEEEIKGVMMAKAPLTTQELVAQFKARLRTTEEKKSFADILKRISKIQRTSNGVSYVVLRES